MQPTAVTWALHARRGCLVLACLLLAGTVEATPLEFPEFDFRITLDSAFKVKSRFKRISSDGGEVFNAQARRLGQSFSCEYQPLPAGLAPDYQASVLRASA